MGGGRESSSFRKEKKRRPVSEARKRSQVPGLRHSPPLRSATAAAASSRYRRDVVIARRGLRAFVQLEAEAPVRASDAVPDRRAEASLETRRARAQRWPVLQRAS
ncbi:hypothetical protein HPB50_004540 [Hyalomma asiaticum]|uniref:Uncharacterized protein n=1 Tax=Hyalomma asiaticum TaxID=266040 RepID=A0ACB7S3Y0_HYAAI|nr:hypothetical protein HPB50_004540 [Hyalomma asiaticum]